MGLWQNLVDSYDKNAVALKKSYPLSTTSISNNSDIIAVIVIDGNGRFIRFDKIEKKSSATQKKPAKPLVNITIPASEESLKRTSTAILPYPVFDQYGYLKGIAGKSEEYIRKFYEHCDHVKDYIKKLKSKKKVASRINKWNNYYKKIKKLESQGKKYDAYIAQLKDFADSSFATKQIEAIYKYVAKRTIAFNIQEYAEKTKNELKIKDQTNVVFQVEIPDNPQSKVWKDETFFDAWHRYYLTRKENSDQKNIQSLDYITGTTQPTAIFHPKKISSASANAKLISSNDKENYTFRGKFSESSEAVSIGYETTQKIHQFLRYLINDRGQKCGEQVILSFTVESTEKLLPPPVEDESIWSFLQKSTTETENDVQINLQAETGINYATALRKSLDGFAYGNALAQHVKTAITVLDAVSDKSGRLSITFYRELDRNEYLKKIVDWHDDCKWNLKFWDKKNKKYVPYIGAPSVDKIIEAIHGKPRSSKDKSFIKIKKGARERLLRCIFDGAFLPTNYVVAAIRRVSNPLGITRDGKFDRNGFERILATTCALVRKNYQQRNREGHKLSIELDRNDRNYLYGRLLGAADKLEEYALYKKDSNRVVTAAIRHMQTFALRPFRTWQTIHGCLNPYIQTVKGGFAFNEIQTVMNKFESGDYEKDVPLNGSFLIGYYHERTYIDSLVKAAGNKKKSTDTIETEVNNDRQ